MEKDSEKVPLMEHESHKFPWLQVSILVVLFALIVIATLWLATSRDPALKEKQQTLEQAAAELCKNDSSCRQRMTSEGMDCFEENYQRSSGSRWYKMLHRSRFMECLEKLR